MIEYPSLASMKWGAGEIKHTKRGRRLVQEAPATPSFWTDWRENSNDMKDAGIFCFKRDEAWIVSRAIDVPEDGKVPDPVTEPANSVPLVAPKAKPTETITIVWSDEQERIFKWGKTGKGHLVVRARAGTGKTTTVKVMFTYCPETRMIYVVFNKRNQREAEAAITDRRVEVRTLHSMGLMFIRRVWKDAKPDENVEADRIRECFENEAIPSEVFGSILKLVSFAKNILVNPSLGDLAYIAVDRDLVSDEYEDIKGGGWDAKKLSEYAYTVLEASKERREDGKISFDDMVWLPVVKEWVIGIYDLVCVDECQDMNLLQLEIAAGAVRGGGRMIVVGDDRQAIYGFRGAHSNGLDNMKERLSANELGLTVTRRNPKAIVRLAQKMVADFKAHDSAPEGIVRSISYEEAISEMKVGDAFLSRINAPLMGACLALLRRGVPARIEGRDIGKALATIVKKLKAHSMKEFYEKLEKWRLKQIDRAMANDTGSKNTKMDHINDKYDTLVAVAEGCKSVPEIEKRLVDMFQDTDSNAKATAVFSSVHKAKGLEWTKVYMLESTFNRRKGVREPSQDQVREEENIKYVAMTRAKHELVFVSDRPKQGNGTTQPTEMPAVQVQKPTPKRKRKPAQDRKVASTSDIVGINSIGQVINDIEQKHQDKFEDDPLIEKALETFKAELETPPNEAE